MKIIDLITLLRKNKIHVWVEDQKLKFQSDNPLTPDILNLLKENKAELIKFLTTTKNNTDYINEKIEKINRKLTLPLTHGQKSMWFFDQFTKGNPVFNITNVVKIQGNLDIQALENSINKVIQRHESLRTTFLNQGGIAIISIKDQLNININQVDFSQDNANDSEKKLHEFLKNESRNSFNLAAGPLLRFVIIKMDNNFCYLCFTMHHIISDAWSNAIFVNEVFTFYKNESGNDTTELQELDIQYVDYAAWLLKWLESDPAKEKINYWKEKLASPVTLQIPTDFPRPKIQGYEGSYVSLKINRDNKDQILKICNDQEVTLFIFLLSVFNTLLYRYTSQEDIMVGTVMANRGIRTLENMIGFFMNTLVLRNDFSGNVSFEEILQRTKSVVYDALNNQEIPFDKLLEELNVERDVSRTPLFQAMFILQNAQSANLELPGLTLQQVEIDRGLSPFDIRLQLTENENSIEGGFEYSTSLFKQETINRMIIHFNNIISAVIENPGINISEIKLLSQDEKEQILNQFNNTDIDFPADKTIIDFFTEHVKLNPGNTAVTYKDQSLTYAQINEKSNQLANILISKGLTSGKIIGLMLERSPEMMIGILAVLKTGCAYLPIDPDYPRERINYIINDSKINFLLTMNKFSEKEIPGNVKKINLDSPDIYTGSTNNPDVKIDPSDIAYIIYTSGSTGKPKGTLIRHLSLINRLNWHNKKFPVTAGDTVLQKTPYTFDVSVWELLWWTFAGAGVCFIEPGFEKIPSEIAKSIHQNKINVMHFVPSMLGAFLDYLKSLDKQEILKLNSLKYIITSGEALTTKHVKDFYEVFKNNRVRLCNLYGPTEATIDVSFFDCAPGADHNVIPIGKPIDNTQLLILDKFNNLQPIGVPGELCIAGVNLAKGYLNREDLTNEKFIDHPFIKGKKLYKTGDLARWLADGNIEFLGRIDFQVKIRGLRIELGEIENLILKYPGINECVVTAWEKSPGNQHLVCYYVCKENTELNQENIQKYLEKLLPDYMIPKIYQALEKMPLSRNGKIDRKSLPEPVIKKSDSIILPANDYEKKIMNIWKEILGLEEISVSDNFFEVGGQSLNLIKVNTEIQKEFNKEISLIDMFTYTTIKSLAQLIKSGDTKNQPLVDNSRIEKQKQAMNRKQKRQRIRR